MNKFIETVKFYFVVVILAIVFNFIMAIPHANASALPPQELMKESADAIIVFVGVCPRPTGQVKCVVGRDPKTNVGWMLLYGNDDMLYSVISKAPDQPEQVRWVKPNRML